MIIKPVPRGLCCLSLLLSAGCRAQTLNVTDTDILNFAMNLECLEAEYYSTAINGYGLNSSTLGSGAPAVGGLKANLSPQLIQIATELANDEINHVSPLAHNLDASSPEPRCYAYILDILSRAGTSSLVRGSSC